MFHRKKFNKDEIKTAVQAKVDAVTQELSTEKLEGFYMEKMYEETDGDLVAHIVAIVTQLEAQGMWDKKAIKDHDNRQLIMVIIGYIMEHYRNV